MKQRQGIIWAPVLIMLGAIVVAGVAGYALLKIGSTTTNENNTTNSSNTNLVRNATTTNTTNNNANTNTATSNTNSVKNSNTSTSTTADWKTYTSKEYGVTFKYPTTWTVEEGLLDGPYSVYAHPTSSADSAGLRFWLDRSYDGLSTPSGAKTTSTAVTYAGRSAVLSKTTASSGTLLIARVQFDITPVGWGADSGISLTPSTTKSIETQLQIMETLSIVDQTVSWKTYTNDQLGFSFKYPNTLRIVEGTGSYGASYPIGLAFFKGNESQGYWFEMDTVVQNQASTIKTFEKAFGFGDLSADIVKKPSLTIGSETAEHYCGIPGNTSYCSAMLMRSGTIFTFNYREPASLPNDILSTLKFIE